jgi:hypothetical protein
VPRPGCVAKSPIFVTSNRTIIKVGTGPEGREDDRRLTGNGVSRLGRARGDGEVGSVAVAAGQGVIDRTVAGLRKIWKAGLAFDRLPQI